MGRLVVGMGVVLGMVCVVAVAQQPPAAAPAPPPVPQLSAAQSPIPDTAEKGAELALRDNAAVRTTEAALGQVRQEVTALVKGLYGQRDALAGKLQGLETKYTAARTQNPNADLSLAREALDALKAQGGEIDKQLQRLLSAGQTAPAAPSAAAAAGRPPIPERFQKILDTAPKITVEIKDDTPLAEALDTVATATGLNFVYAVSVQCHALSFTEATCADILRAVTESLNNQVCFVFRDYGVLVTTPDDAATIPGATIPGDVPYRGEEK